jgi:sigma-B regulation protein RsbU (phosphoserine phosphatase)
MTYMHTSVLVVDDIADNRDLLARRLKRFGIGTVEQAVNGADALAALDRRSFDLMMLDIMMPEMNGHEVLERLKRSGRINEMPVIVISALTDIDAVVRCIEFGAEDFVFKPFNPTLLRARVLATLEKKLLRDRTRDELRRKQAELDEARTLQLALRPPPFRRLLYGRVVEVDVVLEPAREVGGDLVDHFLVGDDLLILVLGDVSDKGAGAALIMARTHAIIRSLATRPDAEATFREPERAVSLVNAALAAANATCMFVTLFLAALDLRNGRLFYVRAGHPPPLLRRSDGTFERLAAAGGLPPGILEYSQYRSATFDLRPGDHLLAVTDGITEAADPAGVLFGSARVEAYHAGAGDAEPYLQRLVAAIREFEAGLPSSDDIAAISLKWSNEHA